MREWVNEGMKKREQDKILLSSLFTLHSLPFTYFVTTMVFITEMAPDLSIYT